VNNQKITQNGSYDFMKISQFDHKKLPIFIEVVVEIL